MSEAIYFFIDGGYVRKKYAESMKRVFGVGNSEPDFSNVQLWCYAHRFGNGIPQRFFFYDCLNDIKKDTETPQDFQRRVEDQNNLFKSIQSLSGFHVRLGSLTGAGKKIRQKKVDVLLAVEMLDNSFRKNMAAAVLMAGDGDFIPVVEAVIRLGTWVEVCYDPHAASEELYSAADRGVRLTTYGLGVQNPSKQSTHYRFGNPLCLRRPQRSHQGISERVKIQMGKTSCWLSVGIS